MRRFAATFANRLPPNADRRIRVLSPFHPRRRLFRGNENSWPFGQPFEQGSNNRGNANGEAVDAVQTLLVSEPRQVELLPNRDNAMDT